MFPLTFEDSFEIPIPEKFAASAIENALIAIVTRLEKSKPSSISSGWDRIEFVGGMLRGVPSWNLLAAIRSGEIEYLLTKTSLLCGSKFVLPNLWFP